MKKRTLYVPANVDIRPTVWMGLHVKDALKALLITVCSIGLAFPVGLLFHVQLIWCVLAVLIVAATSVAALAKTPTGLSISDYIGLSLKFRREQKRYPYVYHANLPGKDAERRV